MASDPPLRESRMLRGWAHGFRSSAKGKYDDTRLGPWLQILRLGKEGCSEAGPMASDPPRYGKVGCYEAGPMASDPPRYGKVGCYEAGPMASDPPRYGKEG
jgi:hypothetical protein